MGGGKSEERIQSEDRLVLWQLSFSWLEEIRGRVGVELEREGVLDWLLLRESWLLEIDWVVQGVGDYLAAYRSIEVVCQRLICVCLLAFLGNKLEELGSLS